MDSDDIIRKLGDCTLAEAKQFILGPNTHMGPGTQLWHHKVANSVRNMKDELHQQAKLVRKPGE